MSTSLVAVRQELEDSRAIVNAARVAEEAGRQQLARMMDEQLAQTQTIEALHRQGCVQDSCMARDTIMWGHQRTLDMLNR